MTLSDSILATLTYSDRFSFPLTLSEIHLRLAKRRSSLTTVKKTLATLMRKGLIESRDDYYFLSGRAAIVGRRLRRFRSSQKLLGRAKELTKRVQRVPGIVAIYLTGSLAVNNSAAGDDIDLMIITKDGRLWTTRLLLTIYTTLFGLRRTPSSKDNSGKLCLNLYLTPASLSIPRSRRSLYTAYELIQAVPLFDPDNTHKSLLSSNSWLKYYLPNYPINIVKAKKVETVSLPLYEKLAYLLQRFYMRSKITREYITPNSAFFHPRRSPSSLLE